LKTFVPPTEPEEARIYERLQFEFGLGSLKARGVLERLRPDMASLDAWTRAFKGTKGQARRRLTHWLQRARTPAEIPGDTEAENEIVRRALRGDFDGKQDDNGTA
jgi:hypothetical protein